MNLGSVILLCLLCLFLGYLIGEDLAEKFYQKMLAEQSAYFNEEMHKMAEQVKKARKEYTEEETLIITEKCGDD